MDHLTNTSPEDWTDRDTFEAMVQQVGGGELDLAVAAARTARRELEGVVPRDHHSAFVVAVDAATDANAARERATTRVALVHGIAIGAALAGFPEDDDEKVAQTGARVASALLASGLPGSAAVALNRTVLDVLGRADVAAMLARAGGAVGAVPTTPTGSREEE